MGLLALGTRIRLPHRFSVVIIIGEQRVDRGGGDIQPKREAVDENTAHAVIALKAGINCGPATKEFTRRQHPRHGIMLDPLALESATRFDRHKSYPGNRTAGCDNRVVTRIVRLKWIKYCW
jgi:hypothetical protein